MSVQSTDGSLQSTNVDSQSATGSTTMASGSLQPGPSLGNLTFNPLLLATGIVTRLVTSPFPAFNLSTLCEMTVYAVQMAEALSSLTDLQKLQVITSAITLLINKSSLPPSEQTLLNMVVPSLLPGLVSVINHLPSISELVQDVEAEATKCCSCL